MKVSKYLLVGIICLPHLAWSQIEVEKVSLSDVEKDSVYISEIQDYKGRDKVLHAEPLYIDLIRDLGARKGEKEWNMGFELADNVKYDSYKGLVEYEWAPIDRVGLEIEVPFTFYAPINRTPKDSIPADRVESFKVAGQWSFLVNEKRATSMAIGYIHEFVFSDLKQFGNPLIQGHLFNPFLIAAKRWGNNFHTLLYTGPVVEHLRGMDKPAFSFEINSNIHYMIRGTRNFIGLEVNKYVIDERMFATLRPQMRLGISEHFLIGIVAGIPVSRENERLSSFARIIWEPGSSKKKK